MGVGQSKGLKGGYRIVKICEDSPASQCDLEIFFDYIIQIDGINITDSSKKTYESFIKKIKKNENKSVILLVYNCRFNKTKEVILSPRKWKGNGLLGININYEPFNALNEGTRIIDIFENSPAGSSDLVEQKDFIIGYEDSILRGREDVLNYVNAKYIEHMKNADNGKLYMTFYIYNIDTQKIRKVKLQPSKTWGGDGLLGFNIANGILHKIPICEPEEKSDGVKKSIDETSINTLQNAEEKTGTTIEEHMEHADDKNKDVNKVVKLLKENTVFENSEDINSNELVNKKESVVTDQTPKGYMDKMSVQNIDNEIKDAEKEREMQRGEKIKLDKDNNFVKIKSGYSIFLTSEENVENMTKKELKEEPEVAIIEEQDGKKDGKEDEKEDGKEGGKEGGKEDGEENGNKNEKNQDSYVQFVEQMQMYTKELDEICDGMNRNNEILSNLGLSTKINNVNYQSGSDQENFVSGDVISEKNLQGRDNENYLENENNCKNEEVSDKGSECKSEKTEEDDKEKRIDEKCEMCDNSVDYIQVKEDEEHIETMHNSSEGDIEKNEEKGTENENNLKKKTDELNETNEPISDDKCRKNNFTNAEGVDLMMNDLPKAGIIYPTVDY